MGVSALWTSTMPPSPMTPCSRPAPSRSSQPVPPLRPAIGAMGDLALQSQQPLLLSDLDGVPPAEIVRMLQIPLKIGDRRRENGVLSMPYPA